MDNLFLWLSINLFNVNSLFFFIGFVVSIFVLYFFFNSIKELIIDYIYDMFPNLKFFEVLFFCLILTSFVVFFFFGGF